MLHESIIEEILEVRVESSRGRQNPRAVKRKMSSYPTRHRQYVHRKRRQLEVKVLK